MESGIGFVKVPRSVLSLAVWQNPYQCSLYFYCLLKASHNHYGDLLPGQLDTSAPAVARDLGQSRNGVRTHLKSLEALGLIRTERTEHGIRITVNGWEQTFGGKTAGRETASGGHDVVVRGHAMTSRGQEMTLPEGHEMHSPGSQDDPGQQEVFQEYIQEKERTVSAGGQTREGAFSDARFADFWKAYPNRQARQDALLAWNRLKPDEALFNRIMAGLARWKASDEWRREGGRFIPRPAGWLNGKRWEDEVMEYRAPPAVRAQAYTQRDYSGREQEAMERFLARFPDEEEGTGA